MYCYFSDQCDWTHFESYKCSDDHPENVLSSMQTIMVVLLEESEDIREDLLFIILSKLGRNRKVSVFISSTKIIGIAICYPTICLTKLRGWWFRNYQRQGVSTASRKLAMNVIESCAAKLEQVIKEFLVSSMSGDSEPLNEQIDYHEVIYDLYECAPQLLSGVIPYLTGELLVLM